MSGALVSCVLALIARQRRCLQLREPYAHWLVGNLDAGGGASLDPGELAIMASL